MATPTTNFPNVTDAADFIKTCRKLNKTIGLVNGCFDIIHAGHVFLLIEARKWVDALVVALNSDSSIQKLKGKERPVLPQPHRFSVISNLKPVDFCFVFDDINCATIIAELVPDVWIKGSQYTMQSIDVSELSVARSKHIMMRFVPDQWDCSTTGILKAYMNRLPGSRMVR